MIMGEIKKKKRKKKKKLYNSVGIYLFKVNFEHMSHLVLLLLLLTLNKYLPAGKHLLQPISVFHGNQKNNNFMLSRTLTEIILAVILLSNRFLLVQNGSSRKRL